MGRLDRPPYGVPLIDNVLLEPLAQACADAGRYEFMLMVLPLASAKGHGQPRQPDRDVLTGPHRLNRRPSLPRGAPMRRRFLGVIVAGMV